MDLKLFPVTILPTLSPQGKKRHGWGPDVAIGLASEKRDPEALLSPVATISLSGLCPQTLKTVRSSHPRLQDFPLLNHTFP